MHSSCVETESEKTSRYLKRTYQPNNSHNFSEFELQLLKFDSRIRVYSPIEDNLEDDQFYIPRKDMICIPFGLIKLSHEIAHMVEMNNLKRLVLPDWGMPLDFYKSKKSFFQALSREIRVRSIQNHIDDGEAKPFFFKRSFILDI